MRYPSSALSAPFPAPWSVDEQEACFIVRDANGQALAYVYFEEEPGQRAAAKLLTRDEARRIAAKRLGSYRAGRTDCWIKVKNPAAPVVSQFEFCVCKAPARARLRHRSSQQDAGCIVARGFVDHDKIYAALRPISQFFKGMRVEIGVNQNGARRYLLLA